MSRLLIATTNPGKQQEFRRLLAPLAGQLTTGPSPDWPTRAGAADIQRAKAPGSCPRAG